MVLYIYSITFKNHPLRLDGLEGVGAPSSPPRSVTAGPLCAVVSDAPEELRPRHSDIGRHQEVQQRLLADGAVLPLGFGYTAPDEDAVRQVLEERGDAYADRLHEVEGCAEYNLKASQDEGMLLREILADSETARQLNDDIRADTAGPDAAVRLGEMVANEVRARQEALASGVIEALRPFARDIDSSPPYGADFLDVSFLVNGEQDGLFLATQLSLAHQMGDEFEFRLNGPLPAYSFS
ncbi:GvpL/GvpF family gas vesicle protein [Streptomyces sp. NPDC026665]|uniref:GvpL/GvpF family gas vesicle protein n=1 Tax=Streptomyces sp. NPDC026665 TaxID=3154798 RepID=UPI0033D1C43D